MEFVKWIINKDLEFAKMSAKCKYGDEESVELVQCTYDESTGTLSCPQPHKRGQHVSISQSAELL